MFVDSRGVTADSNVDADICVVGGGAAGITLARDLEATGAKVVILESGGLEYDSDTQALNDGPNIGLNYFPLSASRLRYFGGTTNHWGGVCRPFDAFDFEAHDWIPNSGWPISLRDLETFYPRAAEICQVGSPFWGLDHWQEHGRLSPLPLDQDRIETRVAQVVSKPRRSFGGAYADEMRQSDVVTMLGANVVDIELDDAGRTVTRVQVATLSGSRFTVTARWFVLAVGGVENARLLLACNRQHRNGLGNDNDLVGRYFLEHPRYLAGMIVPSRPDLPTGFYEIHNTGSTQLRGYLALTRRLQQAERLVDVQVRLQPVLASAYVDAQTSPEAAAMRRVTGGGRGTGADADLWRDVARVAADLSTWQTFTMPGAPIPVPYPELVARLARSSPSERRALIPTLLGSVAGVSYQELFGDAPVDSILLTTRIEPVPNPDSRITLGSERDALGIPRAQLDWRLTDLDKRSAVRTLEILGAEIGRAGLGRLKILVDADSSGWPDDLAGGWHHMGTTRMADDPKSGVVDRDCRVHGMSNLYIGGSSVFPTAASGTPTLTIVALTLRLAQHLKGLIR